jgi:hypothetical protein
MNQEKFPFVNLSDQRQCGKVTMSHLFFKEEQVHISIDWCKGKKECGKIFLEKPGSKNYRFNRVRSCLIICITV